MSTVEKFTHLVTQKKAWVCKSRQKTEGESIKDYAFFRTKGTRLFHNKVFRRARKDDVKYCYDYPERAERYLIDHVYVEKGKSLITWKNV